jgi:formylglycine-generating enzyme
MSASELATDNMVWIAAGTFQMGSDAHYPEEAPVRQATVDGFWIDRGQTTNREFAQFVEATGYVTIAERPLDPANYPGAPPENLAPGSLVFKRTDGPVDLRDLSQWWAWTPGACWKHPAGPTSSLDGREAHPVVHVAFEDAAAYAAWAGKTLPTEAQWEYAARGGLDGAAYAWGNTPEKPKQRLANYWHGTFPWRANKGYGQTTPVGTYPPNGYGLRDMAGNVWEWTIDWYTGAHHANRPCCMPDVPGGTPEGSYDPAQPRVRIPRRVVKGGSHLCADTYCLRYRPAARQPQMIDTGMSHIGFRCARTHAPKHESVPNPNPADRRQPGANGLDTGPR